MHPLRAVTVETLTRGEGEDNTNAVTTKNPSSSRSQRRSVTFADASTRVREEDLRLHVMTPFGRGGEEKTVDEENNNRAINGLSSFTRRALGSRASVMETTTGEGGEGGTRRRISSKLDFSPEEEDHERDQNQKLSSSSTYYSESYSSYWRKFRRQRKVVSRKILDNKSMSIFMTLATIWALFGDDVRVLAFPMEYDEIFVGVAIALIVLFALETIMSCFAKGRKYVFGFYFWLDIIACLSLFMDVPEFMAFIGMDPCEGTDSYGTGLEGEE